MNEGIVAPPGKLETEREGRDSGTGIEGTATDCPFDPVAEGTALKPKGESRLPLNRADADEIGVKTGMGIAVGRRGALVCDCP